MSGRKWIVVSGALISMIVIIILALWALCVICNYLQYPPNDTRKAPDFDYRYDLSRNGTINSIFIDARYTFTFVNDVRYLETAGDSIEAKLWGMYVVPAVQFDKNDDVLTISIHIGCGIDNYLGSPHATEYIYLPKNRSYRITSSNEHGNTYVENKTWDYQANNEHLNK